MFHPNSRLKESTDYLLKQVSTFIIASYQSTYIHYIQGSADGFGDF